MEQANYSKADLIEYLDDLSTGYVYLEEANRQRNLLTEQKSMLDKRANGIDLEPQQVARQKVSRGTLIAQIAMGLFGIYHFLGNFSILFSRKYNGELILNKHSLVMMIVALVVLIAAVIWFLKSRKQVAGINNAADQQRAAQMADAQREYAANRSQYRNVSLGIDAMNTLAGKLNGNIREKLSVGILNPDYQNMVAVGTILGYLQNGRTSSLEREGSDPGAYNMYAEELRFGRIFSSLDAIEDKLDTVIQNQGIIQNQLVEVKRAVNEVNDSILTMTDVMAQQLQQLNDSNERIAGNTEQIAANTENIAKECKAIKFYTQVNAYCNAATAWHTRRI